MGKAIFRGLIKERGLIKGQEFTNDSLFKHLLADKTFLELLSNFNDSIGSIAEGHREMSISDFEQAYSGVKLDSETETG